ncbi:MAG: deiodinase-like protein [Verrucomicrobiota bacterium]
MKAVACLLSLVWVLGTVTRAEAQTRPCRDSIGIHGPKAGAEAPDFTLRSVAGVSIQASALWKEKPTVIVTASHTCPVFRGKAAAIESLRKDFAGKVNFIVVYTIEAHPQGDPSPYSGEEWVTPKNEKEGILFRQPTTEAERMERAKACAKREKMTVPIVVDSMANAVWKAYGSAPNCAYIIGKNGKVVEAEPWMDAASLRLILQKLTAG